MFGLSTEMDPIKEGASYNQDIQLAWALQLHMCQIILVGIYSNFRINYSLHTSHNVIHKPQTFYIHI